MPCDAAARLRAAGQRQRPAVAVAGGCSTRRTDAELERTHVVTRRRHVDDDDVVGPPALAAHAAEEPAEVLVAAGGDHEDGDRGRSCPWTRRSSPRPRCAPRPSWWSAHAVGSSRPPRRAARRQLGRRRPARPAQRQTGARRGRRAPGPAARRTGAPRGRRRGGRRRRPMSATAAHPALVTTTSASARSGSIARSRARRTSTASVAPRSSDCRRSRPPSQPAGRTWRHGVQRRSRPAGADEQHDERSAGSLDARGRRGAVVEAAERAGEEPPVVDRPGRSARAPGAAAPTRRRRCPARSGGRGRRGDRSGAPSRCAARAGGPAP